MWAVDRVDDEAERVSKFVFSAPDAVAEAVLYRYPDYRTRTVICCSTQSGCPIGCRFCGAGDNFVRSLTFAEILSQIDTCLGATGEDPDAIERLQIMFMSMGEPLLNQRALIPTLYALHDAWPRAELLVSTSAPRVDYTPFFRASREIPTVGLQFSVHETTDEARDRLIPFESKLNLVGIANLGYGWHETTGRRPFFNYCAHERNAGADDAARLANLFPPAVWCATVSVICERNEGMPRNSEAQRQLAADFAGKLLARGFDVRVFDPAGQDTIGGGCGQLHFVQRWMRDHPDKARPSCGAGRAEILRA